MNLTDQFLRKINYLRVSVTDRCDLRCVYCMKEKMQFLPRKDILTLEEIERLCDNFIELGIEKIRLTGGEPLVRNNIIVDQKEIDQAWDKASEGYDKDSLEKSLQLEGSKIMDAQSFVHGRPAFINSNLN